MPAVEEPASSHTSFFHIPHFGKKAHSEEVTRCRQVKQWQCQKNLDIPQVPYPIPPHNN